MKRKIAGYNDERPARFYRRPLSVRRFIRISAALGDYYMDRFQEGDSTALRQALTYYLPGTRLREHCDSPLGDDDLAIRQRDSVCRKVALVYNERFVPLPQDATIYVGRYLDGSLVDAGNVWTQPGPGLAVARFRFYPAMMAPSRDIAMVLDSAGAFITNHAAGRRVVVMGGSYGSEIGAQVNWERVNAVIEYLKARTGLPAEQFIFQYYGSRAIPEGEVWMRFAVPGEEGPFIAEPPFPCFMHPCGND